MSDERIVLLSALTATAALGSWALMKQPVDLPDTWYEIVWPRDVDAKGVTSFLRAVASERSRSVVAFEVIGHSGTLHYRIGLSKQKTDAILTLLGSFVPGVVTTLVTHDVTAAPTFAWEIRIRSHGRLLRTTEPDQIARALITGMATTKGETVVLQWLVGPRLAPSRVSAAPTRPTESWGDALRLIASGTEKFSAEDRKALQAKVGEAGFRTIGRVGVAGANEAGVRAVAVGC